MASRPLRSTRALVSVATVLLVVSLVALDRERSSPGPLSAVHSREPELRGLDGCATCHGDGDAGMVDACVACHDAVGQQIARSEGIHGDLAGPDRSCGRCHAEHSGQDFELAGPHSFEAAGLDPDAFEHALAGLALGGRHDELSCTRCHEHAAAAVLPRGCSRFLGLDGTCTGCHEDPHAGEYTTDCAACHGQEQPFEEVAAFEHPGAFELAGAHGDPRCSACHAAGGERSLARVLGADGAGTSAPRDCLDCHEDPHAPGLTAAWAELADLPRGAGCAGCHRAEHGTFEGPAPREAMPAGRHAATGFPLEAPHAELACAACHSPGEDLVRAATPRSPEDCASCHGDPHRGEFERGPFAGHRCLDCHERHAFTPATLDAAGHARTSFDLTGAHLGLDCAACHRERHPGGPDGVASAASFHGAPTRCAGCHQDVHDGAFEHAALPALHEGRAGCARCHAAEDFRTVRETPFDHALWARFPLEGAHAAASCEACHAPLDPTDARGRHHDRAPGRACADCHADPHGGQFADGPFAAEGCAACHDVHGFFPPRFSIAEHDARTGFALTGAHAAVACARCHASPPADRAGFVRYAGTSGRCRDCHADPHGGAFDRPGLPASVDGRTSCLRCHGTTSFGALDRFDHDLWTGYPLRGAHARADCRSCHPPGAQDGSGRRLGPAVSTRCADCHADPHAGQFRVDGRSDCARCHASFRRFEETSFDHGRDSAFPLDRDHAALACSACHVPYPLPGGGQVVRYRPLGTECADCHDPRAGRSGR